MGEAVEQCVICLRSIPLGEASGRLDGSPAHVACLDRIRRPGAKIEDRPSPAVFKNTRSDAGDPICPVCGKPIAFGQGAARSREFVLHIVCWDHGDQTPGPPGPPRMSPRDG
jgi:hypothetical protein